ncbi:MAG: vacuolar protein-sorting-associated protein 25 [archaeon]|nr:vacuolar protein-sorting-associated protein 25 [archaeon]
MAASGEASKGGGSFERDFQFPSFYDFPPFFTVQPVRATRQQQEKLWADLVLAYCQHFKIYTLDVDAAASSPLFRNERLKRQLSREGIVEILEVLRQRKNAEWVDKRTKKQARIVWRTAEQWAGLIYDWALRTGHVNTVVTVWDLREGDEFADEEFHGLDQDVLLAALAHLQGQKKAMVFTGNESDSQGVKFFSI